MPVHRGNIVKPREAAAAPTVEFPSAESGLWTLVMTGLDSHLQSEDKQVNIFNYFTYHVSLFRAVLCPTKSPCHSKLFKT